MSMLSVSRREYLVLEQVGRPGGDAALDRARHLVQVRGRGLRVGVGDGLQDLVARAIQVPSQGRVCSFSYSKESGRRRFYFLFLGRAGRQEGEGGAERGRDGGGVKTIVGWHCQVGGKEMRSTPWSGREADGHGRGERGLVLRHTITVHHSTDENGKKEAAGRRCVAVEGQPA